MPAETRTPAEIVRLLAPDRKWQRDIDAILACADAWDREQARAQQTCGTCDCWQVSQTRPNVGLCTSFAYHDYDVDTDRTHSCAAWTSKDPTP